MRPPLTITLLTLVLTLLTTKTLATASDKYDPYNQCGAPFCGSGAAVGAGSAVGAGAVVRSISEQRLGGEGEEKVEEREKDEGKRVSVSV
jgi:hypothetical protein